MTLTLNTFTAQVKSSVQAVYSSVVYRVGLMLTVLMSMVAPSFASAVTLDVDVAPLFDNANIYLPIFMAIFAIPFGIAIAYALVKLIGGAIVGAISGRGGF